MGLHISFTANITYKNFSALDVVRYVPLDRLLLETDSPYIPPRQFRKQRNEPALVVHVAEKLAEIHGKSLTEIAAITTENTRRLFPFAGGFGNIDYRLSSPGVVCFGLRYFGPTDL